MFVAVNMFIERVHINYSSPFLVFSDPLSITHSWIELLATSCRPLSQRAPTIRDSLFWYIAGRTRGIFSHSDLKCQTELAITSLLNLSHCWSASDTAGGTTTRLEAHGAHGESADEGCPSEPEEGSSGLSLTAGGSLLAGAAHDLVAGHVVLICVSRVSCRCRCSVPVAQWGRRIGCACPVR